MQTQDAVSQDVFPVPHLTDLDEFVRQCSDAAINGRSAGQNNMRYLTAGHWQCQICGARYLGLLPATCEACGADGHYLEHPQEIRLEMTSR